MPIPPRLLDGATREFSIGSLFVEERVTLYPGERLLLSTPLPPWQRQEVWTAEQKARFVEGIYLGLGTGFYVRNGLDWNEDAQRKPMSGWLLDGQQRISALRDFVRGGMTIFEDVTFEGLSSPGKLRFMNRSFPCIELEYTDNEVTLKQLYDRLNFGGTPHTPDQRQIPEEDGPALG